MCEISLDGSFIYQIGDQNSASFSILNDIFTIEYNTLNRKTLLSCICDETSGIDSTKFTFDGQIPAQTYVIKNFNFLLNQ